jgi:ankyrin repeat protein
MKMLLTPLLLVSMFSAPLSAQDQEQKETPDTIKLTEPDFVPATTEVSETLSQNDKALIQSAWDGKLADVEVFVAKGANVNLHDKKKRTPLIFAASNGHTPVVEFLLAKGAEVNATDSDDKTALLYASKRSFSETVALLLEKGADVNAQSRKKGITALMLAAVAGDEELVRMLLDHGADASLTDIFGRTAKVLAEKKGNSSVVDMLSELPPQENDS